MDAYRDERETLRKRVAALERELAEVHERVASDSEKEMLRTRVAQLEEYAGADGRARLLEELEAVHEELDRLRWRRAASSPVAYWYLGVLVALGASGAVLALWPAVGFWLVLGLLVAATLTIAMRYSSRSDRARWLRLAEQESRAHTRTRLETNESARRSGPKVRVDTEDQETVPQQRGKVSTRRAGTREP